VRGVEAKGLRAISEEIKVLGKKARDGKLKPEEYTGGTFTISNLGMYEAIDQFTAIVCTPFPPPCALPARVIFYLFGVEHR